MAGASAIGVEPVRHSSERKVCRFQNHLPLGMGNMSIHSEIAIEKYRKVRKMQNTDFEWFISNYEDLFRKYGRTYLSIKDKKVLGQYASYAEGVRTTAQSEELGTFIVQLCDGTKTAYTNLIASINFA